MRFIRANNVSPEKQLSHLVQSTAENVPVPFSFSETPRNYDYAPFAKMTIDAAPRTVFFLAWRDAWGLHRNHGTKELMNHPLVVNRDDLAAELFLKLRKTSSEAGPQGTAR